ncbi:MAG: nucleotidyl transferase AbiEii/AbiGii toxin family protein [Acidobacteria bacterium]|jgi:predicted nucleotidyltransferase component of viral defense system|nr:nucleotidyl transferase AbiEii/AbiGii toxin family protein [Acidobacteriota bacterium]
MSRAPTGLAHSVQVRLVRHAEEIGVDPNLVLTRYATERLLYRLAISRHAGLFILKGALLMLAWLGETLRPTRDADLLGLGEMTDDAISRTFRELCTVAAEPDGLSFDPAAVRVAPIRPGDVYGGQRVDLLARLGPARIKVQVDIGVGDAVEPEAEWLEYPGLLDFPRPRLRAYRPETVIAEKVHAMVTLGTANSRMRDFFDIYALAENERFDSRILSRAIRATFERRRTVVPRELPIALTAEFGMLPDKRTQWAAFLRKGRIRGVSSDFPAVVAALARFLDPVLDEGAAASDSPQEWLPGGPWRPGPSAGGAAVDRE